MPLLTLLVKVMLPPATTVVGLAVMLLITGFTHATAAVTLTVVVPNAVQVPLDTVTDRV